MISVDLSFQKDWGHIEERYGIGKDCWAQRSISQVQQLAVLNLGPVTFALCPYPYLCLCLYVDCLILPGIDIVDCVHEYILAEEQLRRLMETLVSCNFSFFCLGQHHWAIVVSLLVQFESLLSR